MFTKIIFGQTYFQRNAFIWKNTRLQKKIMTYLESTINFASDRMIFGSFCKNRFLGDFCPRKVYGYLKGILVPADFYHESMV